MTDVSRLIGFVGILCVPFAEDKEVLKYLTDVQSALKRLEKIENGEISFTVIDRNTGKEADECTIALKEDWAKSLCYCDMDGFAIQQDGSLILLDDCGKCVWCDRNRFEVRFDG